MPYKHFLGYEKGSDGLPQIVPEQAETVRYIYDLFMSGKTITAIAKQLTVEGIPTPGGKDTWGSRTVESILTNEKYKGDARLQKRFTVDFLQKKMKVNEGEVPQYLGGDTSLVCSAETQSRIDEQVVALVRKQHEKALGILTDNRAKLDELANYLYEHETITGEEFMQILTAA